MEKKMNRIQRWLDRCVTACKSGAWGSALMEVECLEAEIKSAREEIWVKAMNAPQAQRPTFSVFFRQVFRVSTVALSILFALALPLSLESENRSGSVRVLSEEGMFTWVTPDEGKMLEALRSDLSENNRGRAVEVPSLVKHQGRTEAKVIGKVALPLPAAEKKAGEKVKLEGEKSNNEENVPVDKILSLIQAGQKAIRRVEPAVRVVP